jgi:hypothetical protein
VRYLAEMFGCWHFCRNVFCPYFSVAGVFRSRILWAGFDCWPVVGVVIWTGLFCSEQASSRLGFSGFFSGALCGTGIFCDWLFCVELSCRVWTFLPRRLLPLLFCGRCASVSDIVGWPSLCWPVVGVAIRSGLLCVQTFNLIQII